MKEVKCEKCGKKVAEFETGSKLRWNTVMLCRDCWEKMKKQDKQQKERQSIDALREMLGMK